MQISEEVAKELIAEIKALRAEISGYRMGLPVVPTVPAVGATLTHKRKQGKQDAKMRRRETAMRLLSTKAPGIIKFLKAQNP